MKKKIIVSGPILSSSGYGEMCRFALRSLKQHKDLFDIYVNPTNWGNTGNIFQQSEELAWINSLMLKTHQYINSTNNQTNFDISIQVTIPPEWKKMAQFNIGYTAGIETNLISPAWLQPSQEMDKIIVISEHAKSGFMNTVFGDQNGNTFKVTTPVEVCHFPVKNYTDVKLDLDFKNNFNFLVVCQWGPRKNVEQVISSFMEEFKDEEIGLVLKVNFANNSILDRDAVENNLKVFLKNFPNRKCSVTLMHGEMSQEEMNSLYKHPKIKCIVSATHGEGFGFPLFEAAYNELPVIATDWSGHLDFLTVKDEDGAEKKLFAKVDYELKPIAKEHVWQGVLEENTSWAYPVHTSLKSKMREVYKDYNRFKSWAKKLNLYVREKFTEKNIYEKFASFLMNKEEQLILDNLKNNLIDLNNLNDEIIMVD